MEDRQAVHPRISAYTWLLLLAVASAAGDLEPTFGRCCAFGANWARESQQCATFPIPVAGVPSEHQSICITAAGICCLRYYRDKQCQQGKQAAQAGQECTDITEEGGEFYKDCCDGCKLGLVSGNMGMGCNSRFTFGFPWDSAYFHCCNQASVAATGVSDPQQPAYGGGSSSAVDFNTLYPSVTDPVGLVPESEDLCARFPGKLCAHVCVPTPGSYRCQCRAGFTLSVDGKTCIQEAVTDRCQINNPCAHICRDTGISIECLCNPGYALARDQRSCEDVNECVTGLNGCVDGEQVCYNEIGSYSCINADGSFSSPGSLQGIGGHSIGGLAGDGQIGAPLGPYDLGRVSEQGHYSALAGGLGSQAYPGLLPEGYDITQPEGRCPRGYKFNLEARACDDVDECEVTSGLCGHGGICQNTIGSYTCTQIPGVDCPPGFAFDLNLQSCLDVDECILQTDNCNRTSHFCVNTRGSFTCQQKSGPTDCIAGYKYSAEQKICIDVDECDENLHGCEPEKEQCRNTDGAYECDEKCDEGFQFSLALRTCVDQDECVDEPCDPGWQCHNTIGSFVCHELPKAFCPAGYKPLNGTTTSCEDVDECVEGLHTCHPETEICINEIGKYRCEALSINEVDFGVNPYEALPRATFQPPVQECAEGFGYDLNTKRCLDVDECGAGLHNCTLSIERCINTLGGFICRPRRRCNAGFAPDPVTGRCKDVDECLAGVAKCLPGEICINTEGAFECRVECQDGFRYDPTDPAVCVDINECLESPCRRGTRCVNTEGSYRCTLSTTTTATSSPAVTTSPGPTPCPEGFGRNPNSLQCEDIDECLERVCESEQLCQNTYGSYICIWPPCDEGYRRDPNTNVCRDINECDEGSDTCQVGVEECVNTQGGHTCRAKPCPVGRKRDPSNPRRCTDINECETTPCGPEEQCINTFGSYQCRRLAPCRPGFRRNSESRQCEDIDECEENDLCEENERCVNTRGSYRCRTLECSTGYQRDIFGRCRDVDECKEGTHDCRGGERCYNQYGHYTCSGSPADCTKGFRYSSSDRRCHDIDECTENIDSCEWSTQTCVNTVSSYRCIDQQPTCDFGYRYDHEQRACIDIDECGEKKDDCEDGQYCVNTLGSYQCHTHGTASQTCHPGFTFNRTARVCMDIDECSEGIHDCSASEECVNRRGDYACRPKEEVSNSVTTVPSREKEGSDTNELDQTQESGGSGNSKRLRCQNGFRYNRRRRVCVDINECEEGRAICNKMTEVCINTKGDYWCAPAHKPVRATTSSTTTITSTTTTTTTTPAPPPLPPRPQAPQCPPGTLYNTAYRSCRDIDECNDNPCREFEVCENTQGSYKCSCREGFQRSSSTGECIDLNECQLGLHNCETTQRCDNTIGSYACIRIAGCGTGYTLNHNTGECDDDDECELNTHDCDQLGPKYECFNIKGSFRCVKKICPNLQVLSFNGTCVDLACNPGFQPVQHGCIDINECEERISPCRRNERCLNTHGSYRCRPLLNCGVGYELNEIGNQCVDIDECADGSHQCTGNQLCSNRQGSYICQCPPGYRLNSLRQCQDVNECESYFGNICSNTAVCENTEGSYRCNCKKGFKHKADGLACEDVDECTEVDGICHHNCINVWGSYQCTCQPGFTIARDNRTCTDIDECSEYRGRGRLCIGICVNTPGTFKCSCPDGYQLASDGHTCKDIDECETESPCRGENEVCVNTRGGYKCNAIECPDSYTRDTEHKNRCKKAPVFCRDDDETCRRQPLSYSYNFLPLVSNLTLPPTGQVDLFTMRGPLWSYTTVQFDLELESARAPLGVEAAKREFFHLKRTSYNQAVISLVRPITGPQEVQLALNMQLYHQGAFGGSAIAKLLIYVSEYDF
nr:fibrillin-2-like isoform X4 [Penaeus vannamei]